MLSTMGFESSKQRRYVGNWLTSLLILISTPAWLLEASESTSVAKAPTRRPNIIVIFADDHCFRSIGYENPEVKTPRLDALAASGIKFRRAYVASPICAASRASMMTGRFPQQHGVIALDSQAFAPYYAGGAHEDQTLAHRLAQAGYETAFFGKSHLGKPTSYGFQQGDELNDDRQSFQQATAFVKSRRDATRPFFLWLAPHQPHVPLLPEPQWLDLYPPGSIHLPLNFLVQPDGQSVNDQGVPGKPYFRDSEYRNNLDQLSAGPPRDEATMLAFTRAYYAVVSRLDEMTGQFADVLRKEGLLENTIVFYLADNGYHLGSHGLGNKITMHEESVRIPMFAFGAGVSASLESSALVSTLDLYPTVCQLASASMPTDESSPASGPPMGRSLLPLLDRPDDSHRETVFSECVGVGGKRGQGHRMARGTRWKLVLSGADEEFLFDQQEDPFELANRIDDPDLDTVRRTLRQQLSAWMKAIGDRHYPKFE